VLFNPGGIAIEIKESTLIADRDGPFNFWIPDLLIGFQKNIFIKKIFMLSSVFIPLYFFIKPFITAILFIVHLEH